MRTCSCGARTPMSSSSCDGASLIGADSGLRSSFVRAAPASEPAPRTAALGCRAVPGRGRARRTRRSAASGIADRAACADAGDHRVQAIETAFEQRHAIAAEFAALLDHRFEQRFHRRGRVRPRP